LPLRCRTGVVSGGWGAHLIALPGRFHPDRLLALYRAEQRLVRPLLDLIEVDRQKDQRARDQQAVNRF
jgi:hypothetical protein